MINQYVWVNLPCSSKIKKSKKLHLIIYCPRVIHKPCGEFFWIFCPPSPTLWTILLNKTYVVIWTSGKPPPPCYVPCPHCLWMHHKRFKKNWRAILSGSWQVSPNSNNKTKISKLFHSIFRLVHSWQVLVWSDRPPSPFRTLYVSYRVSQLNLPIQRTQYCSINQ